MKWSGGSGSADALLAAVKAKFRAKGELYLEANGAPVTDAELEGIDVEGFLWDFLEEAQERFSPVQEKKEEGTAEKE